MSTESIVRPSTHLVIHKVWLQLRNYWVLIKSLQTGLLLVTAAAGYISGCCLNLKTSSWLALLGSLFLTIGGSTVINMVFDRDIDACMQRTAKRPFPAGSISPAEGWIFGGVMVTSGLIWALALDTLYAAVVLAGVVLDVVIYTMLLKRRTAFSILIGGLAGGMPILAGRVLAVGRLDWVGIFLAIGILLWIPTHILTFSIRNQKDYANAGVPTYPAKYGITATRWLIAVSAMLAAGMIFLAAMQIRVDDGLLGLLGAADGLLSVSVIYSLVRPKSRLDFVLYKGASIYMLVAMSIIILGGL